MPNIVIQSDVLNNVPAFNFKDTGDHTVTFYYTGDADAVRGDVADGKVFYTADGKTTGTYVPSGSVTYTVTTATDGDVISGKSFYKATSTTTATLVIGSYTPSTGGFNIDLTGTTWVFNNSVSDLPSSQYYLNFSDSNSHYWVILSSGGKGDISYEDGKDDTIVYNGSWVDNSYKTITITGGTDASNPALVAWLLTNATKQ